MLARLKSLAMVAIATSALPLSLAAFGVSEWATREHPPLLEPAPALLAEASRPSFDPARPTVVVLLGADLTEITDMVGPYEMFARVGRFNVVTAAPERRPTLLSGGLRILPHYSLAELDALLGGAPPAIVVVPNIPNVAESPNAPLLPWLREQATEGALMHSWCKGAMALAEAGLLDGKSATAHWGDIATLERRYPRVRWVRGVRWLEHGQFVLSAGITSGIDASLRVIARVAGDAEARRVARELRYPSYHFAIDPAAPQYTFGAADAIVVADAAFGSVGRPRIGLALYDGVGELDLSTLYDTHAFTMSANVEAVGEGRVVRSAHGLTLLPSIVLGTDEARARLRELDRLVITGPDAREHGAALAGAVAAIEPALRPHYLHASEPRRFGLELALEDLARSADVATARFAQRRMEYRSSGVHLEGSTVRLEIVLLPLSLAAIGLFALWLMRRVRRSPRNGPGPSASVRVSPATTGQTRGEIMQTKAGDVDVVRIDLEARETRWEVAPGVTVDGYGYDGRVPGPVIEAKQGVPLEVRFTNRLPEPTLIHWHGLRVPAEMDGTQHVQRPVQPGETFVYRFTPPDAGTFWYHPHANEPQQLEKGLYGALIVRGADEPVVDREQILVLDDVRADARGLAKFGGFRERHDGREGGVRLINGRAEPQLTISAGQVERWRIINASSARYIRLSLGGVPFRIIGTDGGLIEAPFETKEVLLPAADRVDILVGPLEEGQTLPIDALRYARMTIEKRGDERFGTLVVGPAKPSRAAIPAHLRTIEPLVRGEARPNRTVRFGVGLSLRRGIDFRVNGETHHHDEPVAIGELQVWDVVNSTLMDHPFHLHGFFFQVLSINGEPPAFRSWEDVVNLPPRSTVRIAWMPDDRPGSWMYHCHILEHHDAGMMGHFDVVP